MTDRYTATVRWTRGDAPFTDMKYGRGHDWLFDGGVIVPGSSSPLVVRPPFSRADAVDPEEAVVAAASACHMLFALAFFAKAKVVVDSYEDEAVGTMGPNASGKLYLQSIVLRPRLRMSGQNRPSPVEIAAIHHRAHEECYIANSLRSDISIDPYPIEFV